MSPVLTRKPAVVGSSPRRTRRKVSGQIFSPIYELPAAKKSGHVEAKKSHCKSVSKGTVHSIVLTHCKLVILSIHLFSERKSTLTELNRIESKTLEDKKKVDS